jgi:uncharacterized protein
LGESPAFEARRAAPPEEPVDRYGAVRQYSLAKIVGVWAAAALPMAALAWLVAPAIADRLSGEGNVPMVKALLLCITVGLIWQFVLVVILISVVEDVCSTLTRSG